MLVKMIGSRALKESLIILLVALDAHLRMCLVSMMMKTCLMGLRPLLFKQSYWIMGRKETSLLYQHQCSKEINIMTISDC